VCLSGSIKCALKVKERETERRKDPKNTEIEYQPVFRMRSAPPPPPTTTTTVLLS